MMGGPLDLPDWAAAGTLVATARAADITSARKRLNGRRSRFGWTASVICAWNLDRVGLPSLSISRQCAVRTRRGQVRSRQLRCVELGKLIPGLFSRPGPTDTHGNRRMRQ